MKFIKTCYGEWINPALVKHFGIDCKKLSDDTTAYRVLADGVPLKIFPYEFRYVEVGRDIYGLGVKKSRWEIAPDCDTEAILKNTRTKACAWLAEFVAKLNKDDDQ